MVRQPLRSATQSGAFGLFAVLYMTAIMLDMVDGWPPPIFAGVVMPLLAYGIWRGVSRRLFLIFLFVASAYVLSRFPDVANHVNLELFLNAVLVLALAYGAVKRVASDDDLFEVIRPVIQLATVVMYAMAGFHKLNADFFNPAVSCAKIFAGSFVFSINDTGQRIVLAVLLLIGAAVGARYVWRLAWRKRVGVALAVFLILTLTVSAGAFYEQRGVWLGPAVFATALGIVAWELVGGLLLLVRRCQGLIVAFSVLVHCALAFVGFVDFGGIAVVLLFAFVPPAQVERLSAPVTVPVLRWSASRVQLYASINLVGTLLEAVPGLGDILQINFYEGLIFNAAVLVLVWPFVRPINHSASPIEWSGVSAWGEKTPRWMLVLPGLLVLHGMTPYLGLRTAGAFSMYSNLRTEGARSNHLLLGSNPMKWWGYQEDVVHILAIDDARARVGHNYGPLNGMLLPVEEFRKRILSWHRQKMTVPVTFTYRGQLYVTSDIANDAIWSTTARSWPMKLLDFRVIQPTGPNQCRW